MSENTPETDAEREAREGNAERTAAAEEAKAAEEAAKSDADANEAVEGTSGR